jgi:hypothetical protein
MSIELPPPAASSPAPPQTGPTLARATEVPLVGSSRRQRESAPAQGSGGEAAPDIEEIYDKVVSRLRRELRGERERVGDVLGNLRPGRSGR